MSSCTNTYSLAVWKLTSNELHPEPYIHLVRFFSIDSIETVIIPAGESKAGNNIVYGIETGIG